MLAVLFGADKLLGVLRTVIIGRQFGLSEELDVFNAANNLPDLLFALISGGALAIAFIPVLSETLSKEGRDSSWRLFSGVANLACSAAGGSGHSRLGWWLLPALALSLLRRRSGRRARPTNGEEESGAQRLRVPARMTVTHATQPCP